LKLELSVVEIDRPRRPRERAEAPEGKALNLEWQVDVDYVGRPRQRRAGAEATEEDALQLRRTDEGVRLAATGREALRHGEEVRPAATPPGSLKLHEEERRPATGRDEGVRWAATPQG
jgi:hypothetical protein